MPRYFFHVHDGVYVQDEVGKELSGVDEARMEALRALPAMASHASSFDEVKQIVIVVRDEAGNRILSARLFVELDEPLV